MSGPIFVCDAHGRPLMPMSAAYARKLLRSGKARRRPHHAFTIIQLTQVVDAPVLRPVVLAVTIHLHTTELMLVVDGEREAAPLLRVVVDLRTALTLRLRRRAAHRHRRRRRSRYRSPRRHRRPFKLRRPSLARSQWGSLLRQRRPATTRFGSNFPTPTIRWRVEAIERVITALRALVPISHIVVRTPSYEKRAVFTSLNPAERRQALIDALGVLDAQGRLVAACSYCGTTDGLIEVDHLLPRSRGGSDRWDNLVLACTACNDRKGDRTPEEAGMVLLPHIVRRLTPPRRGMSYPARTATALLRSTQLGLPIWPLSQLENTASGALPESIVASLKEEPLDQHNQVATTLAKPVSRRHKQRFTARNYPRNTPLRPGMMQVGNTVKRLVQPNQALAVWDEAGQLRVRVVGAQEILPTKSYHLIRLGALCEGRRAGKLVLGIVGAIHSTGRITLLVPWLKQETEMMWDRIVVSPRLHLRLRSTDSVLFFWPAMTDVRGDVATKE